MARNWGPVETASPDERNMARLVLRGAAQGWLSTGCVPARRSTARLRTENLGANPRRDATVDTRAASLASTCLQTLLSTSGWGRELTHPLVGMKPGTGLPTLTRKDHETSDAAQLGMRRPRPCTIPDRIRVVADSPPDSGGPISTEGASHDGSVRRRPATPGALPVGGAVD